MIVIANKKSKPENLRKKYGEDALIIDVTSKAMDDMVRLSPFYPHGGIPVPFRLILLRCLLRGFGRA